MISYVCTIICIYKIQTKHIMRLLSTSAYEDISSTKCKFPCFMCQRRWFCKSTRKSVTQIDVLHDRHGSPHLGVRLPFHLASFPHQSLPQSPNSMFPLLLFFFYITFFSMSLTASQLFHYTSNSSIWLHVPWWHKSFISKPQSSAQSWHTVSAYDMTATWGTNGVRSD